MAEDKRDGVDSPVWDGEEAAGDHEAANTEEVEPPIPALPPAHQGRVLSLKAVKAEPMELQRRTGTDVDSDAPTPPRRTSPQRGGGEEGVPDAPMRHRTTDGISDSSTPSPRRGPAPSPDDSKGNSSGACNRDDSFQPKSKCEGRVKHFDEEKGFGFIHIPNRSQAEEEAYFVHFSGIVGKGFRKLEKGQQVLFDTEWNEQKQKGQAVNVRLICPGTEKGHRQIQESASKRQRSRSPRTGKIIVKKEADEDPLYEAVNDTLTWLFREVLETDTTLHKKVVSYLRQAVKKTAFEGNILNVLQIFADHFFGSLFAAYGDRPWLREAKVDFAWCFDVAAQELFPEDLVSRFEKTKESKGQFSYLLHKAHDIKYDSQRFQQLLFDCVRGGHIEGKKTQNKISEAITNGRATAITEVKQSIGMDIWSSREERSFDIRDLEAFTKAWIESTIKEVKTRGTREGCGLDGILTRANALTIFDGLVQGRAFPQVMTRSLKTEWPEVPWPFVNEQICQLYSGGSFAAPQARLLYGTDQNGELEGLSDKYNARIQRRQGYGRRHQQPVPLPPTPQQHMSSSSRGVQHFGTDEPMHHQSNGRHPQPQAALADDPTRRVEYGRGYGQPPAPLAARLDHQKRRDDYGRGDHSSKEGLSSQPSAYQSRLGEYPARKEGWPGRLQVKQDLDEHDSYGKGRRKVLPRFHADSDSEDDYRRYDGKGSRAGRAEMSRMQNGKGCQGKDGGYGKDGSCDRKGGHGKEPGHGQGGGYGKGSGCAKGRLMKSEVKEEIPEEFHYRPW